MELQTREISGGSINMKNAADAKKNSIRAAEARDVPGILALIKEFAGFENLAHACEVSEKDLRAAVFGEKSFVCCLVAFENEICLAYAIFYPVFKSFRGERSMFLEDLYVSPKMRGRGLGLQMLGRVAQITKEKGFARMDWQALKWNAAAIAFYERIGAGREDENFDFRLRGTAFEDLAAGREML